MHRFLENFDKLGNKKNNVLQLVYTVKCNNFIKCRRSVPRTLKLGRKRK